MAHRRGGHVGEHDDDLLSEVSEGEEMERDDFPDTADDLEPAAPDADTDPVVADVDPSEI